MIIDVHGYLDMHISGQPASAAVEAHARDSGVDLILVSNRAAAGSAGGGADLDEAEANAACLLACEPCPPLVPLYWVRPGKFDSNVVAFAGALRSEPFVGAVFCPLLNDFDLQDQRLLAPYLQVLAELQLPAILSVGPPERGSITHAVALAQRYPQVQFVLYNAGSRTVWPQALEEVRRTLDRGDAQIYLDTSRARTEDVRAALDAVGAQPLLFGSAGRVVDAADAAACRVRLDELRQALSAAEFEQLTATNARRLFRPSMTDPAA